MRCVSWVLIHERFVHESEIEINFLVISYEQKRLRLFDDKNMKKELGGLWKCLRVAGGKKACESITDFLNRFSSSLCVKLNLRSFSISPPNELYIFSSKSRADGGDIH